MLKKLAVVAFAIASIKNIPLSWVVQFYWRVFLTLVVPRRKYLKTKSNTFGIGTKPLDLFEYTTFNTYVSPLEIDMYLHKSNSTYFQDLDLARTTLVTTIFQTLFYKYYDNVNGYFKGKAVSNLPYIPVGTVLCSFKRELKVFQRYQIKSRVLAWDNKWLYVLLKFVTHKKGAEVVCAVAVTKYVFKRNGRITIRPEEFIKELGLYNDEVVAVNEKNYQLVSHLADSTGLEEV